MQLNAFPVTQSVVEVHLLPPQRNPLDIMPITVTNATFRKTCMLDWDTPIVLYATMVLPKQEMLNLLIVLPATLFPDRDPVI